jgi:hypothetical protein
MEISPKAIKNRQRKIEERNQRSKKIKKIKNIKKQNSKKLIYQILKVINNSFPDLIDRIREIEDYRKKLEYELAELITACIAMYIFKEGSRNAFNNDRQEENFKKNYQKIFKMQLPHMDTVDDVMRRLEEKELEDLKTSMVQTLLKKRTLHKFRFMKKLFLVAVDGSRVVSFSKRHCEHCLTQTFESGKVKYFHNVLEAKLVCSNGFSISLSTEWIENPEGDFDKQDCEQKAFERLAEKLKSTYPHLPICITADGLYPKENVFNICKTNHWSLIFTFKGGNLPSVWKQVELLKPLMSDNKYEQRIEENGKKIHRIYCWVNEINYHGYQLNWVECIESVEYPKGNKQEKRFVHITDLKINRSNVSEISCSGRLRWKIENEGFNTQKNHGYNLKHKYSRVSWLAAKNYYQCLQIGHLINQLVELSSECKKLLVGKMTIKQLWKLMIGFLTYCVIDLEEILILSQLRTQIRLE